MEIPDIGIGIRNIGIPEARVFDLPPPIVPYTPVPITEQIGSPVVNIPGCVEFHPDGEEQLEIDDSKSVRVLCDAGYPTYKAWIMYQNNWSLPDQHLFPKFHQHLRVLK